MKKLADIVTMGGAVGGSLLIASNTGLNLPGYALFLASSVAGTYLLRKTKDAPKSLLLTNVFFVAVNVFGLFRAM